LGVPRLKSRDITLLNINKPDRRPAKPVAKRISERDSSKGEKGQLSTGTAITHLLFEESVEK
jgi:hypothetical protein